MSLFPNEQIGPLREHDARKNRLSRADEPFHNWYRFVLAFPPHLVRDYVHRWDLQKGNVILDPFCGTGTTVVESKLMGLHSIGIEMNPVAAFASRVKSNFDSNPDALLQAGQRIMSEARSGMEDGYEQDIIAPEALRLLIKHSISERPLQKVLLLKHLIEEHFHDDNVRDCLLLALAKIAINVASNLRFGPEIGLGKKQEDAPVLEAWEAQVHQMPADLSRHANLAALPDSRVINGDCRDINALLGETEPMDAVFTSPPYPNEKDYTRTTRLELVLLGYVQNSHDLRQLKKGFVRSNTRSVYKSDDDHLLVKDNDRVKQLAESIENRRIELGKTSGFEKQYHRVVLQYFGGMKRHLAGLRKVLKPGARLGYVVGDQASYLRVMIRTGELLAEIAEELGYSNTGIDLFRYRPATATKTELREEVVTLEWPS
jgi:hypothetical protein